MKISEIAKLLPRLGSFDRDIESWAEEFNRVMELSDIDDPRKMFAWAKECVPGRLKGVIEDLKEEDEEVEMIIYPGITDIKTAIEMFLDITSQEKCFNLKSLKIQRMNQLKTLTGDTVNYTYYLLQKVKNLLQLMITRIHY